MHIALGLGLIAPPRSRSVLATESPVRFTAQMVLGASMLLFVLSALRVPIEWFPFMMGVPTPEGAGEAMGLRFLLIVPVMALAAVFTLVDPIGPVIRAGLAVRAAGRRAGAYWEDPDHVEGPDDVFARLLDRDASLRLEDVEGFVAFARGPEWPLRWRRLETWCRAARIAVDRAMREGEPRVTLGGRDLPTEETSYRLERLAHGLDRRRA